MSTSMLETVVQFVHLLVLTSFYLHVYLFVWRILVHSKAESRESHLSHFLSVKITNCNKTVTIRNVGHAENRGLIAGKKMRFYKNLHKIIFLPLKP